MIVLRLFSLAFAFLVLLSGCGSQSKPGDAVSPISQGENLPAPAFDLKDLAGKRIALADMRGKVVFLDFWATWCPPCIRSVPDVAKLHAEYAPRGVEVVSISLDEDKDALHRFVEANDMKTHVVAGEDSDVARHYGVTAIPRFVIIDKEGRITQVWEGYHPSMAGKWREELDRLLKA